LYFIRFQFAPRPTDRPPRPTGDDRVVKTSLSLDDDDAWNARSTR
jgi:hypothetical protein